MIKWNSNFNIPDSAIQIANVHIKIISYETDGKSTIAKVSMTDETGEITVKEYQQTFDRSFTSKNDIYLHMLEQFNGAKIEYDV